MDQASSSISSGNQQEEAAAPAGREVMAAEVQPSQGSKLSDEVHEVQDEAEEETAAGDGDQGLFTPPRVDGGIEQSAIEGAVVDVNVPTVTNNEEKAEQAPESIDAEASLAPREEAGTPGTAADPLLPAANAALPADEQLLERVEEDPSSATQAVIPAEVDARETTPPPASEEGVEAASRTEAVDGIAAEEKAKEDVDKEEVQEASNEDDTQVAKGIGMTETTAPDIGTEEAVASTSNAEEAEPASVSFASPPVQAVAEAAGDIAEGANGVDTGPAGDSTETVAVGNAPSQPEKVDEVIPPADDKMKTPTEASPADPSLTASKPASIDTMSKPSPPTFASPATPKSALAAASPAASSLAPDDPMVKQIALVLKINKELIRLCVDLQTKDLASDVLFKDAALRLQSNLAFLASIADKSTKSTNGTLKDDSAASLLQIEPFPPTLHAPDSQLPKLYQLLASLRPASSANGEQTKRERQRSTSQDSQRKRLKEEPAQLQPQMQPMQAMQSMQTMPTMQQQIQPVQQMQPQMQPQMMQQQANIAMPAHQAVPPPSQHPHADSNGMSTNGAMANVSNPQQVQSLTQAFGPNAVMNLNALQTHYRGQPQAVVSYMEANVPGFRNLPIQVQLQQMTSVQNAAMQRQRQQSQGNNIASSQQQQQPARRSSNVPDAPNRRPGTPQQSAFVQMSSPAPMSAASPASHLMPSPTSYSSPQQQQQQQQSQGQPSASAPGMNPMMSNMPAHIQQHLLQQLQQQQLHNLQMANNQQTAFASSPGSTQPPQPANGLTWPPVQQQPPS